MDHDNHAIEAIAHGDHGDPFSFLGMHDDGKAGLIVRAFLPFAKSVTVVEAADGKKVAELRRIHPAGLFAGRMGRRTTRFPYRFRIATAQGEIELDDAYRFPSFMGDLDVHLLGEGSHARIYNCLGAHPMVLEGVAGVGFAVWAPNARRVSVVGDFNTWDGRRHPMRLRHGIGVWEIFVPGIGPGEVYKYEIKARSGEILPLKADPCGFAAECPPRTGSVVADLSNYVWNDADWLARRAKANGQAAPISIYEVHLGSWRRKLDEGKRSLSYRELADELVPYVRDMGFTHIELLPVSEHPFDGSWGYQPVGLFAPTARFGPPEDFKAFVDRCHAENIGVILDWVPGHFPKDAHGLGRFDGTHLYEHADPRLGEHTDWGTLIYNYGRREVANYLMSNARFWVEEYHIDGLRVDAVASMLYLDYSRKAGEWIPNRYGGNENLAAVAFLKRLNEEIYGDGTGAVTFAEESTAWPMVSRPTYLGGLGFGFKWNMGWMHDTLHYIGKEPVHRAYHHDNLTFGLLYAFTENFVLPLSHDEVVHGKGSLIRRMPGDDWQRFANLRGYFGFMFAHPGKKLLFMGGEFAQWDEWNHASSLDWHLLQFGSHLGIQRLIADLNRVYGETPALYEVDFEAKGFQWVDAGDRDQSVVSFLRRDRDGGDIVLAVSNFTPVVRESYRVGVPETGFYREVINTDAEEYGGSGVGNLGGVEAEYAKWHGFPYSVNLRLPPLGTAIFRRVAEEES